MVYLQAAIFVYMLIGAGFAAAYLEHPKVSKITVPRQILGATISMFLWLPLSLYILITWNDF